MKNRLDSIDNLTREDYKINFKLFLFRAVLTDKEGKIVNVFKKKDKGNALPGISWIAFFFGPYVAIQSRNWIYLWLYGLGTILSQVINTSIPGLTFVSILLPLIITLYYSAYFPYQRWRFIKSKKKEVSRINYIILGTLYYMVINLLLLFGN